MSSHRSPRTAGATLLGSLLLGVLAAPVAVASGDLDTCRVRNVTQDTRGRSFAGMVASAVDGDRLRIRGVCAGGAVARRDIVIRGMGERAPVLTGRGTMRVLKVRSGATVVLRHLRVQGGHAQNGGAVQNQGVLTIYGSVLHHNVATPGGFGGGAIFNQYGALTLRRTVVRHNTAGIGGGIADVSGSVVLEESSIRGNEAGWGGGIVSQHGVIILARSTVTRNRAERAGGLATADGAFVWLDDESSVTANTPDDCSGPGTQADCQ